MVLWLGCSPATARFCAGPRSGAGSAAAPTYTITIPATVPMVSLLGPHDELLRTLERAFPRLDLHVRGNEITLRGP